MTDDWLIVETLASDTRTVIADGGKIKDWGSLARARPYGATASARMFAVVDACATTGIEQHGEVAATRSRTSLQVLAIPVLAAFDVVNAVHLWIGPDDVMPPPKRIVTAWHFDVDEEINYAGPENYEDLIQHMPVELRRDRRSAADNFQHILRFDDRVGYVGMVSNIEGGGSWQGKIVMAAFDNTPRHLQMVARADQNARIARGLFHDISDVDPPEPHVDNAALRLVAVATGIGTGAIDLNTAVIYDWFSTPTGPLARWQRENPEIEPTDQQILAAACKRLETTGERESLVIRVRFDDTDWIATDVEITALNRDRAPQGLIQVSPRN
ncbi:GAF domain-containing protein [Antrihabitans cavernicola]|uniref:Rv3651-like N-terminal domain-containing protein n=1 Tax=Antrihabitans cavernicola TaxID=2495913 RepID=A0A5A7SB56_9NOCA|nr:GAF domain-containing protein [Spelaeibacter cavernicola]KAA0023156.1 hypothetical protein FOY51_11870 [Spelaeibacter cavernicola]